MVDSHSKSTTAPRALTLLFYGSAALNVLLLGALRYSYFEYSRLDMGTLKLDLDVKLSPQASSSSSSSSIFDPSSLAQNSPEIHLSDQLPAPLSSPLQFVFGAGGFTLTNESAWDAILPSTSEGKSLGRVWLRSRAQDKTGAENHEWEEREFGVGMFEDLRCLDITRRAFVRLRDAPAFSTPADDEEEALHAAAGRCLSHLRQAVLCAADTTIEEAHVTCQRETTLGARGEERIEMKCPIESATATGNMVWHHQCRNWRAIWDWMEQR